MAAACDNRSVITEVCPIIENAISVTFHLLISTDCQSLQCDINVLLSEEKEHEFDVIAKKGQPMFSICFDKLE